MLTLTRKTNETIEIQFPDGDILAVIHVKEIRRGQVRIGIKAPKSLEIHRGEVAEQKRKEDHK